MYYAQTDSRNKCIAIHDMSKNALLDLIRLEGYEDVLGKIYTDGKWVDDDTPAERTLSENEQAIIETALNVDYLVCLADLGL